MRLSFVFSALLIGGCYQPASVLTSADILDITVADTTDLMANGEDYLDITVTVDERTASIYPITLSTSSGVLNFNVDPNSSMANQTEVYNNSTGRIDLKMRVGLDPGDVFLTAQANVDGAGYLAQKTIYLDVSPPNTIEVNPLVFNVPADGTQNVRVEVDLYGPSVSGSELTTQVSYGTNYAIKVCCGTESSLVTCNGQPSLRAPQLQILENGQRLNFDLLARRVEATPFVPPSDPIGDIDDADGDGSPDAEDCDDADPNTYPGAPEICDGKINTCNASDTMDAGFPDSDLDGAKDCVDMDIDQFLVVEYVQNPGDDVDCEALDSAISYGVAHMVLEAIPIP